MRIGFATEDAIFGDFENNQAFFQRANEDKKYRVNYFDCQDQYEKNVLEILDKYKVEFTSFGSRRMLKNLKLNHRDNNVRIVVTGGKNKTKGKGMDIER